MSISIHTIKIEKSVIEKMTEHERKFFIVSGHVLNEINFFGKILLWTIPHNKCESKLHDQASATQQLASAKVLAGKLYESWGVIQKLYLKTKLSSETDDLLEEESKKALIELKKYFGKQNLIASIRNKFSFHYDYNDLNSAFSEMAENEDWNIYLSEQNSNCLYYLSELVVNQSMLKAIDAIDQATALSRIITELIDFSGKFIDFLSGYINAMSDKYFQIHMNDTQIVEGPKLIEVTVPYFTIDDK